MFLWPRISRVAKHYISYKEVSTLFTTLFQVVRDSYSQKYVSSYIVILHYYNKRYSKTAQESYLLILALNICHIL